MEERFLIISFYLISFLFVNSGSGSFYSSRYTDPSSTYGDCILEGETEHLKSPYFISLAELQDPKLGYLINDTCILEAEISILAILRSLLDR